MSGNMKSIIGTAVVGFVVFFLLLNYVYNPVSANDVPAAAMNPFVTLAIAAIVIAVVFDWVNGAVGSPVKAGLIIAVSQITLVDVFYPLSGQRGWTTALVSAGVLIVGYVVIGTIYGKFLAPGGGAAAEG